MGTISSNQPVKTGVNLGILSNFVGKPLTGVRKTSNLVMEVQDVRSDDLAQLVISILAPNLSKALPACLSKNRLSMAFRGVVELRIRQILSEDYPREPFLHWKRIVYPAFLLPIVSAIGTLEDNDDAVRSSPDSQLLGPGVQFGSKEWGEIAETLSALWDYGVKVGMEYAHGLPKDRSAYKPLLMVVRNADGELQTPDGKCDAAAALVASVLTFAVRPYPWGTVRWSYNTVDDFFEEYKHIVRSSFRAV